ncbi:hypothetical protein L2E82_30227 [Cichorium intybus]|uniref:Uncharacterized protein n=1 Tax=Cichorium intybus TaxID=13427 RepID=A0ACB9CZU2_CICIN|nr:hypothetical protein L2E82_30227 [Cichorium intybus]
MHNPHQPSSLLSPCRLLRPSLSPSQAIVAFSKQIAPPPLTTDHPTLGLFTKMTADDRRRTMSDLQTSVFTPPPNGVVGKFMCILELSSHKKNIFNTFATVTTRDAWEINFWTLHVVAQVVPRSSSRHALAFGITFLDRRH